MELHRIYAYVFVLVCFIVGSYVYVYPRCDSLVDPEYFLLEQNQVPENSLITEYYKRDFEIKWVQQSSLSAAESMLVF